MTPRLLESRSWSIKQSIKALNKNAAMHLMPGILESAAIDIGQHGWWKSTWGPMRGTFDCKCIWLAVEEALDRFARDNPTLRVEARRFIEWALLEHFDVQTALDLFQLNDVQPDHEGQGWAIYHLNTLAQQIRVRHRL